MFSLVRQSSLKTANVYCDVTQNRKMTSTDVIKKIISEITLQKDRTRFIIDEIFRIIIIIIYITHSIPYWIDSFLRIRYKQKPNFRRIEKIANDFSSQNNECYKPMMKYLISHFTELNL